MVPLLPEEKHFARATHCNSLVENEDHLAKIKLNDPLESVIWQVIGINVEWVALTVESVDLVLLIIVKAFLREILVIAIHFYCDCLVMMHWFSVFIILRNTHHLSEPGIPNKVIMSLSVVMKQIHKDSEFADPATSDIGVYEFLVHHGAVVKANNLVNFNLRGLNLSSGPGDPSKDSEPE